MKMADNTRIAAIHLPTGPVMLFLMASPNPALLMIPNLEAISCNKMVASVENNNAQRRVNPCCIPANVQMVTVPGPIKAAATKLAGPMFFNLLINYIKSLRL